MTWNNKNNITPKTIKKSINNILENIKKDNGKMKNLKNEIKGHNLKNYIKGLKIEMHREAELLNFEKAAKIRDELRKLEKQELTF